MEGALNLGMPGSTLNDAVHKHRGILRVNRLRVRTGEILSKQVHLNYSIPVPTFMAHVRMGGMDITVEEARCSSSGRIHSPRIRWHAIEREHSASFPP